MPPDILMRKLTYLRQLLADLTPLANATLAEVRMEHYKVERLFESLVTAATDILFHELSRKGITPDSYRDAFRLAGELGLLPSDLAIRLQDAAGMRNIIVHMYEEIDYQILQDNIKPALKDFGQFVAEFEATLKDD